MQKIMEIDKEQAAWVMGYDAHWDGYTIGCMADQLEPTFNKHFIRGWLEAQRENTKTQKDDE